MPETVTLECDVCGGTADAVAPDDLPEGWCELTLTDSEDNETEVTVCSFACAHEWLEELEGDGEDEDD